MLSSTLRRMSAAARGSVVLLALALGSVLSVGAQEKPAPQQPPPAQQPPAEQQTGQPKPADPNQQPVFRTGINFVRVDAIVTDKQGNPVSDLKQTDFEVFEDNKPQAVETFRLVKIDMVAPAYTQSTIRSRN